MIVIALMLALFVGVVAFALWWDRQCDAAIAKLNSDPDDPRRFTKWGPGA